MKKSAKASTTKTKKSKERKHIQIKQSKEISPVKEVHQPEQTRFDVPSLPLSHHYHQNSRLLIPQLPKVQHQFSSTQMQQFGSLADSLISVELIKNIIKKQDAGLGKFYDSCPAIVRKAFEKTIKNVQERLNIVREQRIQRMKEDTVVFVPPDMDNWEKHKGNVLNNWIKLYKQTHQEKLNFENLTESQLQIFKQTEQKIKVLSAQVPKQKIEPELQQMTAKLIKQNDQTMSTKLFQLKNEIKDVLSTANQMRKNKQIAWEAREREMFCRENQCKGKGFLMERYPTHTMALFSVEDYFA